jgi:hypothetical protein
MSVFKSLTTSDVLVTPFKTNKNFSFQGSGSFIQSHVGIDRFMGANIPYVSGSDETGQISTQSKSLIYNSVKQLYYTNYLNNPNGSPVNLPQFNLDGTITGNSGSYQPMYYNYVDNTLPAERYFPSSSGEQIGVISIPSNLFGEYIKPGTFSYTYHLTKGPISGSSSRIQTITDDGEGKLFRNEERIGDIIYQHGLAIITNVEEGIYGSSYSFSNYGVGVYGDEIGDILSGTNVTCSFQSTMTIYESQYKCTLNPNEYTYTQNPSAISGSLNSGVVYDFLTGSYFQPYITTVGLYNKANQLVAVGKLSQPLQSSNVSDTTILVNLDL